MDWKIYPLRKPKHLFVRRLLKIAGLIALWGIVIGAIVFFIFFIYLERALPDPESIISRRVKESTKIYDRTGEVVLYDIYDEERRTVIPWEQIPDVMRQATLAAEDSSFYEHGGLDVKGIIRAVFKDITSLGFSQGGSTITQQLVKSAIVGQQKTPSRKLRELILSIQIERRFSKDQIFWMYLNQIPYGSNAYGVESASRTFFGKPASALTLPEAAVLAAVANAPSHYSPYGKYVDDLYARKDFILQRMRDLKFITDDQLTQAKGEELHFQPPGAKLSAPHFVIMAKEYLTQKYGDDILESKGLKIITTLDATLQTSAEELVSKYAQINKTKYKASNAALVSIDPRSGDVLALVGSSNYFDTTNEGNFNVATARRQPGSSFKPFAYAVAFQKGYPDSTLLIDVKTEFNPQCPASGLAKKDPYGQDCYHPHNYDGTYRGPVSLRQALSQSLNVPSVKTLYLAGIDDTISLAERMGITTLTDRSRFGLSLVLGGAEVRLVDLASAYGVFANDGIRNPWFLIKRVEQSDGTVLEETQNRPTRVLDAQTARMVADVLSDNDARAPVFGFSSPLFISGRTVAAKTGTTQENRDAWVVGFTPSLVTGVWTGNNNNASMTAAGAGISASGPLWHEFMVKALASTPNESFVQPDPVSSQKPMLNGSLFYVAPDSVFPSIHSILHHVDRANPLGPPPENPANDPQYNNWEAAVKTLFP